MLQSSKLATPFMRATVPGTVNLGCSQSTVIRDSAVNSAENVCEADDRGGGNHQEGQSTVLPTNFTYSVGLVLSCLGCVLGTGNIWRFPRMVAVASCDSGSLTFILAWVFFLFTWSIPLIVTEYTLGRFTRGSPVVAFYKFLGDKFIWVGSWVTSIAFMISAYFSVVVGWCFYYFYVSCAWPDLPSTEPESRAIFDNFIQTYWPLFNHTLCLLMCGVAVFKGVKGIEIANGVLVPLQLLIVILVFYWSLSREYAEIGIKFMYTPDWGTFLDPKLYVEAACQNAFDTAAGMGLFSAYAAYFSRDTGAVRYSVILPVINNLVSLTCGLTIFATVFSTLIQTSPTLTMPQIIAIMKESGPGSTGLTFTWIPLLMSKLGIMGRVLCGLFFLCLSFAGISSMIAYIELTARTIQDFGVKRIWATVGSLVATFLVGVPSAISVNILSNQDFVWSFALMISGLCYCGLVIYYNPVRYLRVIVNDFAINDWRLPFVWTIVIAGVVPVEAIGLIAWWAYQNIAFTEWYIIHAESLAITFLEWAILAFLVGTVNLMVTIFKVPVLKASASVGYDPYHPETIPLPTQCHSTVEVPIYSHDRLCDDSECGKSQP
ncbi:putative sodium-dependent transporter [Echinococcus granulosus]|nr:putative sodium-dependent transporter [Echinococcus granulosus]